MYQINNPADRAMGGMNQAAGTLSAMQQKRDTTVKAPGKSAGGAMGGAMSGMTAGATVGSLMAAETATGLAAVGGLPALGIGAALGAAAYLFS